ncbi:argonaute-like protein [Macrolepiota fuliginosa MF-IS2]|uniref:Argonaute-like protein n=1 Tax=Macrolepiota fuliginosa MF-IS2 TaxID=1400762 RepID=A0A9P6CAT3_9AGAR|nr:argonaute-like protein [Macrolepiota fuliginosa MF-IS2]
MPPRTAPNRGAGPPQRGRGGGSSYGGGSSHGSDRGGRGHVRSVIVKRPGYGQAGRALTVNVNAYQINIPEETIRHYDAISPESESVAFNIKVIKHLQTVVDVETFTPLAVYDGRKNMFAARDLPLGPSGSASYSFSLQPPNPNARRPPKVFDVKITKVATLNPQVLHEFLAGRQAADNAILTTIMALNVAIRMDVIFQYPTNSKSFFVPADKRDIGGGVELWRGYFQSVRPAANRMLINVDITTAMMYKSGPLLDVCMSFFELRDPRMLAPRNGFTPKMVRALAGFLQNLSVKAIHNNRNRTIKAVSKAGARDLTFDFDGQQMDVATYYQTQANRVLRWPDAVCVEVETGALIPIELCVVAEGKIMKKELFQDKTREMVDFARMRPADRFRDIRRGLDLLSFDRSPIVQHFGIELVSSDPLAIPARVLPTPPLNYHADSREKTVRPANGSWNMVDKKFYRPATIRKWVVIIYEIQHRFNRAAAERVVNDLRGAARARGMNVMMNQPTIKWCNGQGDIPRQFMEAGQECLAQEPGAGKEGPGLFIVILPNTAGDVYVATKHFGDITKGVPTQCMQATKCLRANDQYWNNILLKINPKLGGINSILDPENRGAAFLQEPTIIFGADVMHPPPHSTGIPSYASVVGSVDSHAVKYVAATRAQEGKKEEILGLREMCEHIFRKYKGYQSTVEKKSPQQASPKRLLFFRDGVSEGEFETVRDNEACRAAKFNPKITLIVVGKRHHYRYNPNDRNQADPKSGNCPAGMVVDQVITHPVDFDYYLLSHGGLIGTSRPAHYSVCLLSADSLQSLSFSLCHIFARATRSVSIPAPVYYAHLVCKRAKNHYDPRMGSDTASSSVGGRGNLQDLSERFRPLHENQAGNMYFMVRSSVDPIILVLKRLVGWAAVKMLSTS